MIRCYVRGSQALTNRVWPVPDGIAILTRIVSVIVTVCVAVTVRV